MDKKVISICAISYKYEDAVNVSHDKAFWTITFPDRARPDIQDRLVSAFPLLFL